ncbi:14-3-3 protein zeta [Tritrichomonas foetus]|uniref:14-3-3 protein zeta n=1 Tax=Tritrichomonas foetus TaxID=1144522 RepID=A0A1J4KXS9_9EUKA|nr:14-3-3 protein zeta [Tritrichomonas foetus]|eukprot:OHT15986.1 14-3-3 protein zeta [Tritrichomonas foetus]
MESKIEDLEYMVQISLELSRPKDMIKYINEIVQLKPHLDLNMRILYSQAYHENVSSLRQTIVIIQQFADGAETAEKRKAASDYLAKLRLELHDLCLDVIHTTEKILLPHAENAIDEIFYHKLKADYWRYDAEHQTGEVLQASIKEAESDYTKAIEYAEKNLELTNPVRLGLILNYCVFLVDIKGQRKAGREFAQKTLESAQSSLSDADPSTHNDAEICLKLLKDNCESWFEEDEN